MPAPTEPQQWRPLLCLRPCPLQLRAILLHALRQLRASHARPALLLELYASCRRNMSGAPRASLLGLVPPPVCCTTWVSSWAVKLKSVGALLAP